ncbi:MAG: transposase [Thermoproteota archaeon]
MINTGYGTVPRSHDRARAYLFLKGRVDGIFQFKGARHGDDVVRSLLLASFNNGYVEGSTGLIDACGQTVRNHLRYQDPTTLLGENERIIEEMRSLGALSKPLIVAIDWHNVMYYGDPDAEGVVGTQPKRGSHRAYRFATASVLLNGERLTLAAVPMLDRRAFEYVVILLCRAFELGIKVKFLLLDKGFYSIEMVRWLDSMRIRYVMQIPKHNRSIGPGEDRAYTAKSPARGEESQATFRLVTVEEKGRLLIFATNTHISPERMRELLKSRWGIETSYRMLNKFLARTTSKIYGIRKLYFYLAILLYNLWVLLNYGGGERMIADNLKLIIALSLILSFIPDIEAMT